MLLVIVHHGAGVGAGHMLNIATEPAASDFRDKFWEFLEAGGDLFVGELEVHGASVGVDVDDVAVFDDGDWSAGSGFGRNMAYAKTAGSAGKTAVGNKRGFDAGAFDRGSGREHFLHAGAAFGAFVFDHNNIAVFDFAAEDGGERVFLGIENARCAGEFVHIGFDAGSFDYGAERGDIAVENCEAAGGGEGVFADANDVTVWFGRGVDPIAEGAGDGF